MQAMCEKRFSYACSGSIRGASVVSEPRPGHLPSQVYDHLPGRVRMIKCKKDWHGDCFATVISSLFCFLERIIACMVQHCSRKLRLLRSRVCVEINIELSSFSPLNFRFSFLSLLGRQERGPSLLSIFTSLLPLRRRRLIIRHTNCAIACDRIPQTFGRYRRIGSTPIAYPFMIPQPSTLPT